VTLTELINVVHQRAAEHPAAEAAESAGPPSTTWRCPVSEHSGDLLDHAMANWGTDSDDGARGSGGGGTGNAGEFSPAHPPAHFPFLTSRYTPQGTICIPTNTPPNSGKSGGVAREHRLPPRIPHPSSITKSNDHCPSNAHGRPGRANRGRRRVMGSGAIPRGRQGIPHPDH
jgi:hypothetical protein